MIHAGLCSITLQKLDWKAVIAAASEASLKGIEWWGGETHVPHNRPALAREVGEATRAAGLAVASYGSYYRVGVSGEEMPFEQVLGTAVALGAPTIRVWAGNKDAEQVSGPERADIIADTLRIADLAAQAGITVAFEYHPGTLTNSPDNAAAFAAEVVHPSVRFYWQPPFGRDPAWCRDSLQALLPRLANLHVFQWTIGAPDKNTIHSGIRPPVWPDEYYRHPLADGEALWRDYLSLASRAEGDRWALLEFSKNSTPEDVVADARVLSKLLSEIQSY